MSGVVQGGWEFVAGAYIVTAWLWGIIVNLLLIPGYYDMPCVTSGCRSARSLSVV